MATLTIRDLPDEVRDKLRVRAAENGRSMEAEVRAIVAAHVEPAGGQDPFLARVSRAQEALADLTPSPSLASDELIAERRLEAWREEVETNEWLREHGRKTL